MPTPSRPLVGATTTARRKDIVVPEIVWEDPPPKRYGAHRVGRGRWAEFAEELRKHPGKWAVADVGKAYAGAYGMRSQRLRTLGCEVTTRKQDDGTYTLYARWPEEVAS